MIPEIVERSQTSHEFVPEMAPLSPVLISNPAEMKGQVRTAQISRTTASIDRDSQSPLPMRKSSLRSKPAMPRYRPPPTPLSQMSLEELMDILPSLDAAIIAQDWLPCMQIKHQNLKSLLEAAQQRSVAENESSQPFDKELANIVDQSQDVARTYHQLFEIAEDLQNNDLDKKNVEINEANARASEAKVVLARFVSKHREVCLAYERAMKENKDVTQYVLEEASNFIRQQLNNGTQPEGQSAGRILELLTTKVRPDIPIRHISTDLYHDTQKALKMVTEEKYDLQEICSTQMATIRKQSADLDRHIERMTKVMTMMQEKEYENRELRGQNDELRLVVDAHENALRVNQESKFDEEQFQRTTTSQIRSLNVAHEDQLSQRDAEIVNLRGKLDKAFAREHDLHTQIRSLLQSSQSESGPNRQGRLKRLLTSGPRGTTNLPTTTSMHNLSHSVFTPFETGRSLPSAPPSPTKSGRSSPTLAGLCEPGVMDQLELPPPHSGHNRTQSSVERRPRLREGFQTPQDRDIDSAVSGRFYHMPSNVKSAASILRSRTPKEGSEVSYDGASEYGRPRQNSAPGDLDLGRRPSHHGYKDLDQQMNHQRVLSGITEVTEDTGSVKRNSSSPSSVDRKMYIESMRALGRLQVHY